MVRKHWTNLNGPWDFAISAPTEPEHVTFDKKILVPFPVESTLSGLGLHVPEGDQIWYRRTFEAHRSGRTLLHFGASDFETTVWVNGKEVGHHKGGYDPFTFDVTEALHDKAEQQLIVRAVDPTDHGTQPRGKQVVKPGGIFYTSTSGIWQTVWLEQVPDVSIDKFAMNAHADGQLSLSFKIRGLAASLKYSVTVLDGHHTVAEKSESDSPDIELKVANPKLWSPGSPTLYGLRLSIKDNTGKTVDSVDSYTAFRSVKIAPDKDGVQRIFLNGEPCFMVGPLDQGFWPDGIYTPPTDEALKYDIEFTKELGFNMIRKHVKVEPDRWYYWCDKLGILVWQDMPSGDGSISPKDPDIHRTPESAHQYEAELKAMIDALRNHPSIVTWIPFNEGWGQFDTARITDLIRAYDPTRLIDSTTGWADRGVGDMLDWHIYPGPEAPKPEAHRVSVLGEFGGLGLPVPDHMWQTENWGYQSYKTHEELTDAVILLFEKLRPLIDSPGLSAAVYTQTTDVETEANGLLTYDRAVEKNDRKRLHKAITDLYGLIHAR
jgi:beta-galactosidase/beta-glucuronidase